LKFELHHIIPALKPYLRAICSIENPVGLDKNPAFRVLPDTCVELFIRYNCSSIASITTHGAFSSAGSFVTSRLSAFMDVEMLPGSGAVALCFEPGEAFRFFGLPMKELADNTVCLHDLWGSRIAELEESIAACLSNRQRAIKIQDFLLGELKKGDRSSPAFEYCLRQINRNKGLARVQELSKETSISQRQLTRQFDTYLGLSPKAFSRMTRFLFALEQLKASRSNSPMAIGLTRLAYDSGYYDQAHFIHDCREFAGLSPKEVISSNVIIC
jgi:AraC-like DNA-binding protein